MKPLLIVATRNAHKVEEISAILRDFEIRDLSVIEDPPTVEETGITFLENATLKALAISALTDAAVISDDSGLEVDALDGRPGVRSSRYAGEDGNDALNNAELLRELGDEEDRTARFRCVLVLARQGERLAHFAGSVEGRILKKVSGAGGFGYDPLFVPDGYQASFAELGEEIKNSLSHRARALGELQTWLANKGSGSF